MFEEIEKNEKEVKKKCFNDNKEKNHRLVAAFLSVN